MAAPFCIALDFIGIPHKVAAECMNTGTIVWHKSLFYTVILVL